MHIMDLSFKARMDLLKIDNFELTRDILCSGRCFQYCSSSPIQYILHL